MDLILDANAYIQALYKHGRKFLQTSQFAELLAYLKRTGSQLVIPDLTHKEVVARYRDRLIELSKRARDAWAALREVGMEERGEFPRLDIPGELATLDNLLFHPSQGVDSLPYTDFSGVDIKEVARRGIFRVLPANDRGEELRDVILWLVVLHYAKQVNTTIGFVSEDKAFRDGTGTLHQVLQKEAEQSGVTIAFFRSIGDFLKGNALESEPLEPVAIASYVTSDELRGIATQRLLRSGLWGGVITGVEDVRPQLAEARRYRIAGTSYYIEARYTGEGTIRAVWLATASIGLNPSAIADLSPVGSVSYTMNEGAYDEGGASLIEEGAPYSEVPEMLPEEAFNLGLVSSHSFQPLDASSIAKVNESSYKCHFELRLSLRIKGDRRESLEVEGFDLLGEIARIAPGPA